MLALRNILWCDRWKEEWPKIEVRLRQQVAQRRSKLHQSRTEQEALITPKVIPLPFPIVEAMPVSPVTKQLDFPHPPKDNPWRKFKFGRSLYQLKEPPKN